MATAIAPRPPKFVPALNAPQVVAIASVPGRLVPSEFGPSEVVFSLTDGRPWYVPQVIANEIYAAGIMPRQQIEVTAVGKKKTEVRIVPVQTALAREPQSGRYQSSGSARTLGWSPDRDYTPELEKSIEQVNAERARAAAAAHPQAGPLSPTSLRFMGAYKDAVDALIETQGYAKGRGLLLEIRCEDVRCLAATMMIQAGGR